MLWCHCGFGLLSALILILWMKQLRMKFSSPVLYVNTWSPVMVSQKKCCLLLFWRWTWRDFSPVWLEMSPTVGRPSLPLTGSDSRAAADGTGLILTKAAAGACINTWGPSLNHRCERADKLLKQVCDQLHEKKINGKLPLTCLRGKSAKNEIGVIKWLWCLSARQ